MKYRIVKVAINICVRNIEYVQKLNVDLIYGDRLKRCSFFITMKRFHLIQSLSEFVTFMHKVNGTG